jgi:hypothetical protein
LQIRLVKNDKLLPAPQAKRWTRPEDYVVALARLRSARQRHQVQPRSEPEEPRAMLGTVPFLVLTAALAMLALAIIASAWPGHEPPQAKPAAASEQGRAPPDWFDKAKRELR